MFFLSAQNHCFSLLLSLASQNHFLFSTASYIRNKEMFIFVSSQFFSKLGLGTSFIITLRNRFFTFLTISLQFAF